MSSVATGGAPVAAASPAWLRPLSGRRLAVLGADGFIGSHVVRRAVSASASVTAVCVKDPWRLAGLEDEPVEVERVTGGRWWEPSCLRELEPLVAPADALVLLAYEPPSVRSPTDRLKHELSVNSAGAERIGKLAARLGTRLVFASSADVYGPWRESPVTEGNRADPETPYARAKLVTEELLAAAAPPGGLVCARLATVFGPGENGPRAIPSFIRALARSEPPVVHGDGSDLRDYVYVGDVAAALVNACSEPASAGEPTVVNVGSGIGRTTIEVLRIVAQAMNAIPIPTPRFTPSSRPPSRLVLDPALARRRLGFRPGTDFEAAVREEAEWLAGHVGSRRG